MFTNIQIKDAGWIKCEILGTTSKGSIRIMRSDNNEVYLINRTTFRFYKLHDELELIPQKVKMPSGQEVMFLV